MEMGMYQQKLDRFYKGQCLPEYDDALIIAREAGVPSGEVFEALAYEQAKKKGTLEKISKGFNLLLALVKPRGYWVSARC